jgi:translation initiation factor IF-1
MTPGSIHGAGEVVEVLKKGLWRVRLSNGHEVTAFLGKKEANLVDRLSKGKQVCVSLTPFDMSTGRIFKILGTENES